MPASLCSAWSTEGPPLYWASLFEVRTCKLDVSFICRLTSLGFYWRGLFNIILVDSHLRATNPERCNRPLSHPGCSRLPFNLETECSIRVPSHHGWAAPHNHRPRQPAGALISIVGSEWPGPGSYLGQLSKIQQSSRFHTPDSIVGSKPAQSVSPSLSIHLWISFGIITPPQSIKFELVSKL